jgi:hypothetical protein
MSQGTGKSVPEMTPQKCMTPQGLLRTLKADFFFFLVEEKFLVFSLQQRQARSPLTNICEEFGSWALSVAQV